MKIKIFLMSVLISISNSALASDDGFRFDLGSTPITDVTIPPIIINDDLGKNVDLYGGNWVSLDTVGNIGYFSGVKYKIKNDKTFESFNFIYSDSLSPKQGLINNYYYKKPIILRDSSTKEFTIYGSYLSGAINLPKFWNQEIYDDIYSNEARNFIQNLKSWYLVIKFTDGTFDIFSQERNWSFMRIKVQGKIIYQK